MTSFVPANLHANCACECARCHCALSVVTVKVVCHMEPELGCGKVRDQRLTGNCRRLELIFAAQNSARKHRRSGEGGLLEVGRGHPEGAPEGERVLVFPSPKSHVNLRFMHERGKEIAERAELNKTNGLHRFRDTAATRWLRAGIELRTVQEWLGHESPRHDAEIFGALEEDGEAGWSGPSSSFRHPHSKRQLHGSPSNLFIRHQLPSVLRCTPQAADFRGDHHR